MNKTTAEQRAEQAAQAQMIKDEDLAIVTGGNHTECDPSVELMNLGSTHIG